MARRAARRAGLPGTLLLSLVITAWTTVPGARLDAQNALPAQPGLAARIGEATPPPDAAAPPEPPPSPFAAEVRVDATRSAPPDGAPDVYAACGLPSSEPAPTWRRWESLDGDPVAASSTSPDVRVFACRTPVGVSLCVTNHGAARADLRLTVRVPAGAYTVERLGFGFGEGETTPRAQRLQSVIVPSGGSVRKPGWLLPGTASIYRLVNRSAQCAASLRAAKGLVRQVLVERPREGRRLRSPMRDCEAHVAALFGKAAGADRRLALKHIHRALLYLAQAESMCRNGAGLGRLAPDDARALAGKLASLGSGLAEWSAACLGIAAGVEVEPAGEPGSSVRRVSVWVTNGGCAALSSVKMGAAGPRGCRVTPAEEAMFDALQPGQTARARFRVVLEDGAADPTIGADIAYFCAGTPAHLRLSTF
ncbi:MAG: hypothetical protein IT208_06445 [Chthonomonadales bacterium]|nr:hypothetical protein [Chthonomonadales bacterium]